MVADLPWDGSAVDMSLTWSPDSKWCAFYANMSRTSETTVYHLRGDKFVEMAERRSWESMSKATCAWCGNADSLDKTGRPVA